MVEMKKELAVLEREINNMNVLPLTASVGEGNIIANPVPLSRGLSIATSAATSVAAGAATTFPERIERNERLRLDDIRPLINKFSGDELYPIKKWLQDFEFILESLNAMPQDHLRFGRQMLSGSAELYIKNKVFRSWQEFKASLSSEFERTISVSEVMTQLKVRYRKPDESIHRYALEMQTIAHQARIDEDELVQCIINGLRDNSSAIAVFHVANTVNELKKAIPKYESRRRALFLERQRFVERPSIPRMASGMVQQRPNMGPSQRPLLCFGCSQPGHLSRDCPKSLQEKRPKDNCFACNQPGHFIRDCPQRQQRPQRPPQQPVAAIVHTNEGTGNYSENNNERFNWYDAINSEAIDEMQQVSVDFLRSNVKLDKHFDANALIDTGSPVNFVRRSLVPTAVLENHRLFQSTFSGIGNKPLLTYGKIQCNVSIRGKTNIIDCFVLPDRILPADFLLGQNFLSVFGIRLFFTQRQSAAIQILKHFHEILAKFNECQPWSLW